MTPGRNLGREIKKSRRRPENEVVHPARKLVRVQQERQQPNGGLSHLPLESPSSSERMTAEEFVTETGRKHSLVVVTAFDGDLDLFTIPITTAQDVLHATNHLQEHGFVTHTCGDLSVHVHAPHRKEHSWGDRGWNCEVGLTVEECENARKEVFRDAAGI